ncbi:hypothetical protein PoB_003913100 [Plakobranchus ocellatus]|uniref:Uncharacterized protein n=1 Tax=Plakobranchus ocellatus TaxID=259542 RepID=A0AAV4AN88_9GAST|nr:hypothetical protein PoB_003913100 [Plakobranchus ocellatus]
MAIDIVHVWNEAEVTEASTTRGLVCARNKAASPRSPHGERSRTCGVRDPQEQHSPRSPQGERSRVYGMRGLQVRGAPRRPCEMSREGGNGGARWQHPRRGLVRVAMGDSSTQEAPARGLGRVSMEGSARGAPARGAPARGLVRRRIEVNNAQGAPARGLVRVAMDEDNAQGAPERGLVRVAMEEDNAQGAPASLGRRRMWRKVNGLPLCQTA